MPSTRLRSAALLATIGLLAGSAGIGAAAFAAPAHPVTLSIDGASRVATVRAATVAQALDEAGVALTPADAVVPARGEAIADRMAIRVTRAHPTWVMESGIGDAERREVPGASLTEQLTKLRETAPQAALALARTPADPRLLPLVTDRTRVRVHVDGADVEVTAAPGLSASDVLAHGGLTLGPLDRVSLALDGEGLPSLTVTRITRAGETEQVEMPFATEETPDDTLFEGQRIVDTEGVAGLKEVTYATQARDGAEASRVVVKEEVVHEPQTEVVRVGTKPLPAGGAAPGSGVPVGEAQQMALAILPEFGFDEGQFGCLQTLWTHESGWNASSLNTSSGAYGIPQALPGSKMASAGADWRTNPATQIRWGLGYIRGRYATPCGALAAWQSKGWY